MVNSPLQSKYTKAPLLTASEVRQRMPTLRHWTKKGKTLRRTYTFASFLSGISFANRLAKKAEEANHHPDIDIRYKQVTLTLTTHDAGGITEKDFELAMACDVIFSRFFSSDSKPSRKPQPEPHPKRQG